MIPFIEFPFNKKFGGTKPSDSRMHKFKMNIDACNMLDFGFSGPRFT